MIVRSAARRALGFRLQAPFRGEKFVVRLDVDETAFVEATLAYAARREWLRNQRLNTIFFVDVIFKSLWQQDQLPSRSAFDVSLHEPPPDNVSIHYR